MIDAGSAFSLVEIKQTATPRPDHFKALKNLLPLFPRAAGFVCSLAPERERVSAGLSSVPLHALTDAVLPKGRKP